MTFIFKSRRLPMATPKTYHTQQHKAILSFVSQQKNCFTAAELSDALRAAGEKVGLATIYRQLEKLEKSGSLFEPLFA